MVSQHPSLISSMAPSDTGTSQWAFAAFETSYASAEVVCCNLKESSGHPAIAQPGRRITENISVASGCSYNGSIATQRGKPFPEPSIRQRRALHEVSGQRQSSTGPANKLRTYNPCVGDSGPENLQRVETALPIQKAKCESPGETPDWPGKTFPKYADATVAVGTVIMHYAVIVCSMLPSRFSDFKEAVLFDQPDWIAYLCGEQKPAASGRTRGGRQEHHVLVGGGLQKVLQPRLRSFRGCSRCNVRRCMDGVDQGIGRIIASIASGKCMVVGARGAGEEWHYDTIGKLQGQNCIQQEAVAVIENDEQPNLSAEENVEIMEDDVGFETGFGEISAFKSNLNTISRVHKSHSTFSTLAAARSMECSNLGPSSPMSLQTSSHVDNSFLQPLSTAACPHPDAKSGNIKMC